jgi:urease accessory protein UreE
MIHSVKYQAFAVRADQDKLLFAAAYKLGNRDTAALGHGVSEQSVRLLTAFIRLRGNGVFSK